MTHAYGGVEHKQPGPSKECLLCEVERLKDALRLIADPRTPSMTGGFTGQTKPASRLREIAREALAGLDTPADPDALHDYLDCTCDGEEGCAYCGGTPADSQPENGTAA